MIGKWVGWQLWVNFIWSSPDFRVIIYDGNGHISPTRMTRFKFYHIFSHITLQGQGLTWGYPYNYDDDSRLLSLIILRNDGTGFCCLRGFRTSRTTRKLDKTFLKEKSLKQPADSINDDHLRINEACDAKTHLQSSSVCLKKRKPNQFWGF